jgi:hypothetical protein
MMNFLRGDTGLKEAVHTDYWLLCTYPYMTVIDAAGLARGVFGLQ